MYKGRSGLLKDEKSLETKNHLSKASNLYHRIK